jgi:hypothetical protein
VPLVVFAALTLRAAALTTATAEKARRTALALQLLAPPTPGAWALIGLATILGVVVAASPWLRRPAAAAATLAGFAVGVHLLATLVVLPRFDRAVSARPIGEALARVAGHGVTLVMHGFPDREAIAPLLFYAHRRIPEVRRVRHLRNILLTRRACAIVGANAYARLPPDVRRLPSMPVLASRRRFVLVAAARGGCPDRAR